MTTFEQWLAQQTLLANPGPHAHNLGLTFDALPCGCAGPDRIRCYCEERHLQERLDWLHQKGDLMPNLGPEPMAAKWRCTCPKHEVRPGMRHLIIHPNGDVYHWPCRQKIGQVQARAWSPPALLGG